MDNNLNNVNKAIVCGSCRICVETAAVKCPVCGGSVVIWPGSPESAPKYHVLRRHADGRSGQFFLIEDRYLNLRKVLRVSDPTRMPASDFERVEQNAIAVRRLNHFNTARMLDLWKTADGRIFSIFEWVDGMPLDQIVGGRRVSMLTSLIILDQLGRVLTAAHALGVIHREVSARNVYIVNGTSVSSGVRLMGFASLKITDSEIIDLKTLVLTKDFKFGILSPEQIENLPVTARTDVWSLGVLGFELLTGQKLFNGFLGAADPSRVDKVHISGLNPKVAAVLGKAMAYSPKDRHATVAEFIAELRTAIADIIVLPPDLFPPIAVAQPVKKTVPQATHEFPIQTVGALKIETDKVESRQTAEVKPADTKTTTITEVVSDAGSKIFIISRDKVMNFGNKTFGLANDGFIWVRDEIDKPVSRKEIIAFIAIATAILALLIISATVVYLLGGAK